MQVQNVDAVGAEAAEARLDVAGDLLGPERPVGAAAEADLGGYEQVVAVPGEDGRENLLGLASAVCVSSVDEVDASVDFSFEHCVGSRDVDLADGWHLPTKGHSSQSEPRHLESRCAQDSSFQLATLRHPGMLAAGPLGEGA
jgi:hypothetical protein